jgi:HSP20 family molecular chaperone IbpA
MRSSIVAGIFEQWKHVADAHHGGGGGGESSEKIGPSSTLSTKYNNNKRPTSNSTIRAVRVIDTEKQREIKQPTQNAAVDIIKDKANGCVHIHVAVPGVSSINDVTLSMDNRRCMYVIARRSPEQYVDQIKQRECDKYDTKSTKATTSKFLLREIPSTLHRKIMLPRDVIPESATVNLVHGMLDIRFSIIISPSSNKAHCADENDDGDNIL